MRLQLNNRIQARITISGFFIPELCAGLTLVDIFKGLNILIADDSRLNNRTLKQLLELSGACVSTAENGLEAIACLRVAKDPIHLILMDVNMPVLDGLQASRIIREDKKFSSIPIIAVTADRSPQDQRQCFQAGMDAHIAKPLDYETLCTAIKDTLESKYNQLDLLDDWLEEDIEVESKQEIVKSNSPKKSD